MTDLEDQKVMEGTKKVAFSCKFFSARPKPKVRWFKNKLEIFPGHKYHFDNEDDEYTLTINNVKLEDGGKYSIECNKSKMGAWLYVEGKVM